MKETTREDFTYNTIQPKMGDVYWADIPNAIGSQQGNRRPVLIVSNDFANKYSPTVDAIPLTTKKQNKNLPIHVKLKADEVSGLQKDSTALVESRWTLNKDQLLNKIGEIPYNKKIEVGLAILIQNPFAQWAMHNLEKNKIMQA